MATVIEGVSWATYESLVNDLKDRPTPRLAYNEGALEIMSPLPAHEERKDLLVLFIQLVAMERRIPWKSAGSSTFRQAAQDRGFEPDGCFYIQSISRLPRSLRRFNAQTLPAPDLVIEIDLTNPSLDKLPLYAAFGVGEVWRDDEERVHILRRDGEIWSEADESGVLPGVTGDVLTGFMARALEVDSLVWTDEVRAWAHGEQSGQVGSGHALSGI